MNIPLSFKIAVIGGILAGLLVKYIGRFAPKIKEDNTSSEAKVYTKGSILKLASFSLILSWISIIALLLSISFILLNNFLKINEYILIQIFFATTISMLFSSLSYMAISISLKCPLCNNRFTIQWTMTPPKFSSKVLWFRGWAATLVDVAINNKFQCMYCGQNFVLSDSKSDKDSREIV